MYRSKLFTCSRSRIMKQLFVMFSKNTSIKLLQVRRKSGQTRNTIIFQQMKAIIINVTKSSIPQETRWKCTFIMMREVCKILCMRRCPFQLQESSILHFGHNDHVVKNLTYFNFSTKDMNREALFSNVHKRQTIPFVSTRSHL